MNHLYIDFGHYSVKFIEIRPDKKMPKVVNHHEVILDKVRPQLDANLTDEELHLEIATSFLSTGDFKGKSVMLLGNSP